MILNTVEVGEGRGGGDPVLLLHGLFGAAQPGGPHHSGRARSRISMRRFSAAFGSAGLRG